MGTCPAGERADVPWEKGGLSLSSTQGRRGVYRTLSGSSNLAAYYTGRGALIFGWHLRQPETGM